MAPRLKQDYSALMAEYDQRISAGETPQAIKASFQEHGVHWGTFQNHRRQAKKKITQETPMIDETPVEVLPGQMSIEDADTAAQDVPNASSPILPELQDVLVRLDRQMDTPAEVHYGAVNEFDALPDGYAKEIQPMRPYSDAEEWALDKSMELYGFIGAIVRDQYGRILDGNQRQRVARLRGLGVPHTITKVEDDAHALKIATALNTVKRYYPREQRLELAALMREQGFSYREMAVALGVSKDTVQRDIFGTYLVIDAPEPTAEIVSNETMPSDTHETIVSNETMPSVTSEPQPIPAHKFPERVKRKDAKGTYPSQRPPKTPAPKPTADITGLKWVKIFQSMFAKYTETVEAFQLEGGITVLARDMPTEAQQLFLGLLKDQAQRWEEMVAHFERTITAPTWADETPATE